MRLGNGDTDGGSGFVSETLKELGSCLLGPTVERLAALRVTPNMVTGFSLVPALVAGVAVAFGWFALTFILGTIGALCGLAGVLARKSGAAAKAGDVVSAAADRYVESFFLCGLIIHCRSDLIMLLFSLGALFGSFMMSYATAKAAAMGVRPPPGLMRRAERGLCLLTASGLTTLSMAILSASPSRALRELPIIVAVAAVAVAANASAVQRFAVITRVLRANRPAPIASPRAVIEAESLITARRLV